MTTRPETDRATYEPTVQPPPPQKASLIEDFIDIFYTPSSVFARHEKGGFGMALLVITLLSALFAFASRSVFSQIFDAEFSRRSAQMIAKNPRLTQEALDKMRPMQENFGQVFLYIYPPILILFLAVVVWLIAKVVSAKLTYTQAATIVTFAWIPRVVASLLVAVQVLVTDTANITSPQHLSYSPARFMDVDTANAKVLAAAAHIDVFTIWFTVLVAIGIAVVAKVPRSKGYLAAGILFLVGFVPVLFA